MNIRGCEKVLAISFYHSYSIILSFYLFIFSRVFFKSKKLFLLFSYSLILCNKTAGYNWYSQNRIKISILGNMITCIYFNYLYFLYRNTRCNFFLFILILKIIFLLSKIFVFHFISLDQGMI